MCSSWLVQLVLFPYQILGVYRLMSYSQSSFFEILIILINTTFLSIKKDPKIELHFKLSKLIYFSVGF